jgi:hypothetical protein
MMLKSYKEIQKIYLRNDIRDLILVMLLLILFLYFIPSFKVVFLFGLLLLFFFSKRENDFFWIVVALVLIDYPMNLFWQMQDYIFRFGRIKLSYIHMFSIISFVKILVRPGYLKSSGLLKKPFIIYILMVSILLVVGLTNGIRGGGKTGYRYIYQFGLTFFIIPLFISVPKMLDNLKSLRRFTNLIFFLVIINFIGQLISVALRQNLHSLFGGEIPENWDSGIFYSTTDLVRPAFGALIHFFAFLISTYYYFSRDLFYKKRLLLVIIVISYFSCLITASRGWIIAYTFFLILTLYNSFRSGKFLTTVIRTVIILVPFIILVFINSTFRNHFNKVFERLSTIELLMQGDITVGGTNTRLSDRSLTVMTKFYEKPILGWGYSQVGMETSDGHVGNQTNLMFGGLIGFLVILYILIYFIMKILKLNNALSTINIYKKSLPVLIFAIIALVIIHSSSSQIFGYYLYSGPNGPLGIIIFFSLINEFYKEARIQEMNFKTI